MCSFSARCVACLALGWSQSVACSRKKPTLCSEWLKSPGGGVARNSGRIEPREARSWPKLGATVAVRCGGAGIRGPGWLCQVVLPMCPIRSWPRNQAWPHRKAAVAPSFGKIPQPCTVLLSPSFARRIPTTCLGGPCAVFPTPSTPSGPPLELTAQHARKGSTPRCARLRSAPSSSRLRRSDTTRLAKSGRDRYFCASRRF